MPRRPGLPPARPSPPPALPHVFLAVDHPRHVIEANVRAERWVAVQRGAYVAALADQDEHAERRYLSLASVVAARRRLRVDHVMSHTSAALLWGLPLFRTPSEVHVIQGWSANSRVSRQVVRHVCPLPDEEIVVRAGLRVTDLERTAVDCALLLGPTGGLVVLDAALHRGADRERCAELLARRGSTRGVRAARAVLDAADDGAESPGESLLRLALLRLGIVRPQTQVRVQTGNGTFWADLGWEEWRVLGEYDGVAKYGARGSATEEVLREKRRERAMEETGQQVLRFDRHDVFRPRLLEPRVRRALPPEAFTAHVDPHLRA